LAESLDVPFLARTHIFFLDLCGTSISEKARLIKYLFMCPKMECPENLMAGHHVPIEIAIPLGAHPPCFDKPSTATPFRGAQVSL